ncbi:MAG: hypothetical protein BMS9Abin05_0220 [Rhodothermia bacterium]|nr:MAG: hypothetical protein BMS9Abin05_0220 [Rhodothermia bacterium]
MRNGPVSIPLFVIFIALFCSGVAHGQTFEFSWDRSTIYAIITDQFYNGDPSNDQADRQLDARISSSASSSQFGGDFAGILAKIEEGYFSSLGVDAISISLVNPRSSSGDAYSSIWPVDYTDISPSFGTVDEFERLVDTAHEQDLRVIMEVTLPERTEEFAIDSVSSERGPLIREILDEKWGDSGSEMTSSLIRYFDRSGYPVNSDYMAIKWLTDWVRIFGVDAFRVRDAESIKKDLFSVLKAEGVAALREWKSEHPTKSRDDLEFWLMADVQDHGPEKSQFHDAGVDATTNFGFANGDDDLDSIYADYSASITADPTYNIVSFVSSAASELYDRTDLIDAGTELFLLPGVIQIFYGDETARPQGENRSIDGDSPSPMNWDDADERVRSHWSKLGQFRAQHPSVAAGVHEKINDDPYAFYRGVRIGANVDEIIVVMGATGRTQLNVRKYFPDDTILRDAYTGKISMVSFGEAAFEAGENGVLLLETVQ